MKNKLFILSLMLLCTAQIASCMDEQRIVPLQSSITFDENIDKICAGYFSKALRYVSNINLGTHIKKTTPCIWANFVIKHECPQFPGITRTSRTEFAGALPLYALLTNSDKIMLPKVHFKHQKSSEQLVSIVQKAEENFEKSADLFAFSQIDFFAFSQIEIADILCEQKQFGCVLLSLPTLLGPDFVPPFTCLTRQHALEQIQKYIDKEIVLEKSKKIMLFGESIIEPYYEHGPRGFGSPLQGQKGNIAKLLMQREKTGSLKK